MLHLDWWLSWDSQLFTFDVEARLAMVLDLLDLIEKMKQPLKSELGSNSAFHLGTWFLSSLHNVLSQHYSMCSLINHTIILNNA